MSDISDDWPEILDDDGSGRYGTPVNNTNVWDPIKAAINAQVLSGTNPTLTPAQIIDEVVEARGNKASLDERLSTVIDDDANFIVPDTVVSTERGGTLPQGNLVENADLLVWCEGDDAPPSGFSAVTNSLNVQRAGPSSGHSTSVLGFGENCMYLPIDAASAYPAYAPHDILNTTEFARCLGFRGRKIAFGARIKADDANCIGVALYDGVTTTVYYHSGNGQEAWVGGLHTLSGGATQIQIRIVVAQSNAAVARAGALCAVFSDVALKDFIPPVMQAGVIHFAGESAVASGVSRFLPGRLGIVTGVMLHGGVGSNTVETDLTNWDDNVNTSVSMFAAGGPALTSGSPFAFKAPDGDYFRRCLQPVVSPGLQEANGQILSFDVTLDTTGGIDLTGEVRVLQYVRPLECFKDHLG